MSHGNAPGGDLPPKALSSFCKALDENSALQSKVKAAENPQRIIEIAASTGHDISSVELRIWSRELVADYFPWATKGHEWRRNFFKQKR
jgi:predicted ribosomally synthesized peptide with nif11-like leader